MCYANEMKVPGVPDRKKKQKERERESESENGENGIKKE